MTIKEKHKELKRQVNEAEMKRRIRRGPKSWSDLRRLKKEKLAAKDKLVKSKKWTFGITKWKLINTI